MNINPNRKSRLKLIIFSGLLILITGTVKAAPPIKGPIWDPYAKAYLYVVPAGSWTQAESEAQALGGHLVTIRSSTENQFIVDNILRDFTEAGGQDLSNLPLWIGLYDPKGALQDDGPGGPDSIHAANFKWVSGSSSTYRNWSGPSGQPDDNRSEGSGEYYTAINWLAAHGEHEPIPGSWGDVPLDGTRGWGGRTDGPYYGIAEVAIRPGLAAKSGAPIPLTLELSDGSSVIGVPDTDRLEMTTDFANVEIPFPLLSEIEFTGTNSSAHATFLNGDLLTGQVKAEEIGLKTIFGSVTIPMSVVRKIEGTMAGMAPSKTESN